MANDVFANGREISCKKADGKTVCAFPDVCFTPPENPATPPGVPVPYPNTAFAKDTSSGSKNVKISGQEVMLKNKSYFKTSTGNEAGCAAKKGFVTSKIKGKAYFTSWSMDVKFEGENIVRHLDMTTHNHASPMGNESVPWLHVDKMSEAVQKACSKEIKKAVKACKGKSPKKCGEECRKAQKCLLVRKLDDKKVCCKPDTTGHHLIEDHWVKGNDDFDYRSNRATSSFPKQSLRGYKQTVRTAPCVCTNAERSKGKHGVMHDVQGVFEESSLPGGARQDEPWNYGAGKEAALWAHQEAFPDSRCSDECLEAQLDDFYGGDNDRSLNKPETQGLGDERGELEYIWSDVFENP